MTSMKDSAGSTGPARVSRAVAFALAGVFALAAPTAAQMKIGVFDAAKVLLESRVGSDAQDRLNRFKNDRQTQITAREKEFTDLQNKFVTQSLTLSPEKKDEMQKQLETKKTELRRFVSDSENELMDQLNKVQKDLQGKLSNVVETYGKEQGYSLIFDRLQCVFNSDAVDITREITARFDASYASPSVAPAPRR